MRRILPCLLALGVAAGVVLYAQVQPGETDPDPTKARPAPATIGTFRGQVGKTYRFTVTANAQAGTVWGTDVYTDDSAIAAAVVHAGLLRHGETGVVKITVLGGQDAYQGSTRNGVTTNGYGPWGGSFRFEGKAAQARPARPNGPNNPLKDPGTLTSFRGRVGETIFIEVTGADNGASVWGSGPYTDDSSLARAAVHSGLLKKGEKGVVKVTIVEGQPSYTGTTGNGITTSDYGSWGGSYRIEAVTDKDREKK